MSRTCRRSTERAVEVIRNSAIPLHAADDLVDPGPILKLLGSPDVVGLGEPTHGDSESIRLKDAVIRALATSRRRTLIAWERGVGQMEHVAAFVAADQDVPHESRRWLYPWVYEEVADLLGWLRAANKDRPESVSLCGVDMDGPAPPGVYDELIAVIDRNGVEPLRSIRDTAIAARKSPGSEKMYRSVFDALAELEPAAQHLRPTDRLMLDATAQWARFGQLTLADRARTGGSDELTAAAHRDRCMAMNLATQVRIREPQLTVFTAHNGHVSLESPMAGWHLSRTPDVDYTSVGMAFGRGRFNAGTVRKHGAFDPRLAPIDAEPPPEGSLEHLLGQVGLAAFVMDLRVFRGTDHVLGSEMTLREIGLAGGAPQFEFRSTPAELYDVLVWFDAVTPASIAREDGDFW